MLHIDPLTARGAATALALEETLQQILGRRPDLQRSALLAGLHERAQSTPYSVQAWADHCLDCVCRSEPLPWESTARVTRNEPTPNK